MDDILYEQRQLHISKHLILFSTIAVFIFALTKFWIGTKVSAYFEAAFLLPFYYLVFKHWWFFKRSKMTWLCIAMLAIPVLQFLIQYYENPVLAMKYQGVDKLFRLTFFLGAAFWLSFNLRLVTWFIVANLLGLTILLLSQDDLVHIAKLALTGNRASWGQINAQFAAMYASIGIFALACLHPLRRNHVSLKVKSFRNISTYATAILLFLVIFISQTRAAIGGLILSIITISILFGRYKNLSLAMALKPRINKVAILFILLLFMAILSQPTISTKMSVEWTQSRANADKLISDEFGGGRGELWKYGLDKISEKAFIGWGGESRIDLITQAEELSAETRNHLWHMHNSWLEFGLAYGMIGAILLTVLIAIAFIKASRAWHHNLLPTHIATFTLLSISFTCFINLFESYLFFWQGGYLITWTCTPTFAYLISKKH